MHSSQRIVVEASQIPSVLCLETPSGFLLRKRSCSLCSAGLSCTWPSTLPPDLTYLLLLLLLLSSYTSFHAFPWTHQTCYPSRKLALLAPVTCPTLYPDIHMTPSSFTHLLFFGFFFFTNFTFSGRLPMAPLYKVSYNRTFPMLQYLLYFST